MLQKWEFLDRELTDKYENIYKHGGGNVAKNYLKGL